MHFNVVITQILILFIIILIGFIIRKKNIINEQLNKGLAELLIDVTMPALIITSMAIEITPETIVNIRTMSIISILAYLFVIIVAFFLVKKLPLSSSRKAAFQFLLIFGNVGYMGYPVLHALYPDYGIFYAIINNIAFNIFMWTYGVYLFVSDENYSVFDNLNQLLNNGIIATVIGFILLLLNIQLPNIIFQALEKVGNMTFPLAMLIIGSSLSNLKLKTIIKDKIIYLLVILKLLILPLLGLLILRQFNIPELITNISIILLAMPAATNTVILAEKYEGNYLFASEGVFVTTFLSLITIPLFIWLIQFF